MEPSQVGWGAHRGQLHEQQNGSQQQQQQQNGWAPAKEGETVSCQVCNAGRGEGLLSGFKVFTLTPIRSRGSPALLSGTTTTHWYS